MGVVCCQVCNESGRGVDEIRMGVCAQMAYYTYKHASRDGVPFIINKRCTKTEIVLAYKLTNTGVVSSGF